MVRGLWGGSGCGRGGCGVGVLGWVGVGGGQDIRLNSTVDSQCLFYLRTHIQNIYPGTWLVVVLEHETVYFWGNEYFHAILLPWQIVSDKCCIWSACNWSCEALIDTRSLNQSDRGSTFALIQTWTMTLCSMKMSATMTRRVARTIQWRV